MLPFKPMFAGVGSRHGVPQHVKIQQMTVATLAEEMGIGLRSGGALNSDQNFERGIKNPKNKRIYLPWENYEYNPSKLFNPLDDEEAYSSVEQYHSRAAVMTAGVYAMMARNYQIVCGGPDERWDVEFVACWTPDGARTNEERSVRTGGTGQAISIADSKFIPVYNFYHEADFEACVDHIYEIGELLNGC